MVKHAWSLAVLGALAACAGDPAGTTDAAREGGGLDAVAAPDVRAPEDVAPERPRDVQFADVVRDDALTPCGLMLCEAPYRCCLSQFTCYDPATPWLCPMPDGGGPPDAASCGGALCGPGLVCCASTGRCVDPSVPGLCGEFDAGVCGGISCGIDQACCPATASCYDQRTPEACPRPGSDGGGADAGFDAHGPPCGASLCAPTELCCGLTTRCYDPRACPECCM